MSDRQLTGLFAKVAAFNDWYLLNIPGGAGLCQPRQTINLHKGLIGPLCLVFMFAADDFSMCALLYLALHGTYGVLWIIKDVSYGDPSWARPSSLGSAIATFIFPLGLYYLPMLILFTPLGEVVPGGWGTTETMSPWTAFGAVVLFLFGSQLHFVGDAQKHYVLKHQRPRQLITDGTFAASRNPNYLGEIMMYAGFALLSQHWLPFVAFAWVWVQVFGVNMWKKELSMRRYEAHAAWRKKSGFLLLNPITMLRALPLALRRMSDD